MNLPYYAHRFYDHQADLNITNPAVRAEIQKIMGFWLALGVSGFRIDAAAYLIELRQPLHPIAKRCGFSIADSSYTIHLNRYGYRWLRVMNSFG